MNPEAQPNSKIFELNENFFIILKSEDWIKNYILWELKLFSLLGYNLELDKIVTKKIEKDKFFYQLNSQSEDRIIPNFLIENDFSANDEELIKGLKLVSDFLDK